MPAKRGEPSLVTKRVADLLRMRLAELRWTQQRLADSSDVSQSHVSQILAGNRHIYIDQLARMCHAMGISMRDVIGEAESARGALLNQLDEQTQAADEDVRAIHSEPNIA